MKLKSCKQKCDNKSLFIKEKQKDADNADLVFMYQKSGKLQNSSVYNNISYTQSTLRGMR